MLKVVDCFVDPHDMRLVELAIVVCALSATALVELVRYAQNGGRRHQAFWVATAAVAGGCGIWATHFIAMLAFDSALPSGYDLWLTSISLVDAIVLTWVGLATALRMRRSEAPFVGGAILGIGIAAMHYTGMAAFKVAGHLHWNLALVALSIGVGVILSGMALKLAIGGATLRYRLAGACGILVAICSHHFIGMSAVTIIPDPAVPVPVAGFATTSLAITVALASKLILLLACTGLMLDAKARRRAMVEESLRSLANAAVEGLVVCDRGVIVNANESFCNLVGSSPAVLAGRPLADFLRSEGIGSVSAAAERTLEIDLLPIDGEPIPVEVISHAILYRNEPHAAVAVRDLRARRGAERQIQFLARHDALTKLANRTTFNERLDRDMRLAEASGRKLAVLFLDLDRFKEVNDLYGHSAGDGMLERVAQVSTGVLREGDMMARLGGDEFAVLAMIDEREQAGTLAAVVLRALQRCNADSCGPVIAGSIGIALYPDDAEDRVALLNHADTALYRAKGEGRGVFCFYEADMGADIRDRRLLAQDLRHAVERGEMKLLFQPQTDVRSGGVTGFEALLRWTHPLRGAVSPIDFIPIAEENGAILQIGRWALREACGEAARWPNPLAIAVNVSAVQIHSSGFQQTLSEILAETGLAPSRLEIEITETALIRDPARALATLQDVKALGVRIAMDDFGTGYSSLSNLRTFPFDRIKIDGSFMRSVHNDPQAAAIVRSVVDLGRGLDLPVLAEGVEAETELRFLQAIRCDGAQGYLLGRPAPIERFRENTHGRRAAACCKVA